MEKRTPKEKVRGYFALITRGRFRKSTNSSAEFADSTYQIWPGQKKYVHSRMPQPQQFEDVKTKAEICMKEEKYAAAFFHWTKAIHLAVAGKVRTFGEGHKIEKNPPLKFAVTQ